MSTLLFAGITSGKTPDSKPPLTPHEVRLVGRANIIYEIAGCNSRGKGEC